MLALLLAALADPAPAADAPKAGPVDKLHKRVVAAIRNCAEGEAGEIVVCSPDRGVAEAYRLPRLDPRYAERAAPDAAPDLKKPGVGESGFGTCSGGGVASMAGCQAKLDGDWGDWKKREQARGTGFPW